jgi:hypothetical protein
VLDTTYFGRSFGVMVFRGWPLRKNLYWKFVRHEKKEEYVSGVRYLEDQGWEITAVVCDGKPGLFKAFGSIPVQMCHVHQMRIVIRYITRKPKLEASIELLGVLEWLIMTDRATFTGLLAQWHTKWVSFLAERTKDPITGRRCYTHRRLRSAYHSLIRNLPYLFTFEQHGHLSIPTTTNTLEGTFSQLKKKVHIHSGLKSHRKMKLICELLS